MKGFRGLAVLVILSRVALLLLLALLQFVFPAYAIAETQTTTMYVSIEEGSTLNGRSDPSVDSTRVCYFHRGDELEVIETSGDWSRVNASNVGVSCYSMPDGTCWVASEFLRESKYLSLDVEDDV